MAGKTAALRRLLAEEAFIHLPVAYDAIGGRLIEPRISNCAFGNSGDIPLMIFVMRSASSLDVIRTSTSAAASAGTTLDRMPPCTIPTVTEVPVAASFKACSLMICREISSTAFTPLPGSMPA